LVNADNYYSDSFRELLSQLDGPLIAYDELDVTVYATPGVASTADADMRIDMYNNVDLNSDNFIL
jgi:hypothetical protein